MFVGKAQVAPIPGPSRPEIRAHLEKILASEIFRRSERLSGLLRFVVETTLQGEQHVLKEQTIAQEFFGRGEGFEGASDPIVRVEARRLRDKLREYYAEADGDSVVITLPKGSYVPAFERNPATTPVIVPLPEKPTPIAEPGARLSRRPILWVAGALAMVLAAGVTWLALRSYPAPAPRVRMLTTLPGNESSPSLSPDGEGIVFAWSNGGPADLYIKEVNGEPLRRLTETPQNEFSPRWSPDARAIAFSRERGGVFVISTMTGAERKIAEAVGWLDWSPDSRSVFVLMSCEGEATNVFCIYQIALDTLKKRAVTSADPTRIYSGLAVSPDGQTLAVVLGIARHDVYLVPAAGGEPKRLTTVNRHISGIAWAPDGQSLFYSVLEGTRFGLRRVSASGTGGNGELVTALSENVRYPSTSRDKTGGGFSIAYQNWIHDVSLRLVELNPTGPSDPVGVATPFVDATEGRDCGGRFSRDASQIALYSNRSGESRLWLVLRDGSGLRPFTSIPGQELGPGGWSPDGGQIVFHGDPEGNSDIYVYDGGPKPRRLTSEPSLDALPAWSPDGHWIYFTSDRSGSFQIWKAPSAGGPAVQVTQAGGQDPHLSLDGKYIYYLAGVPLASRRPTVLKRIPASGGEESVIAEGIIFRNWSVTAKGIYNLVPEKDRHFLERIDHVSGQRTRLGVLPFQVALATCGFTTVSQDARFLLANHLDRDESNLGLIEGLR